MIGEKIRKIRTIKGFSQDYMAIKLGVKQPAYSEIETGKTKVSLDKIEEIAKIFEIEVDELINFDENQIFNNTFNENSKGFFNVKKYVNENFEHERQSNQDQIKTLKEEIIYLRKKLDEK